MIVKVGYAKTHLSELLAKVEAGEEIVISRGTEPIARLTRVPRQDDRLACIDEIKAARAGRDRTTVDELLEWREAGKRF